MEVGWNVGMVVEDHKAFPSFASGRGGRAVGWTELGLSFWYSPVSWFPLPPRCRIEGCRKFQNGRPMRMCLLFLVPTLLDPTEPPSSF